MPMCLFAAISGVYLRGMDNNIFTQIGFVVPVGLACKNAILIVEYARQQMDEGVDRREAVVNAAKREAPTRPNRHRHTFQRVLVSYDLLDCARRKIGRYVSVTW